jgi:hypothetical protein
LLVWHEGVTLVACCELRLLHHVDVVLHAFAVGVCVGKLECVDPSEPVENSNSFISLGTKRRGEKGITHRPPKVPPETELNFLIGSTSISYGRTSHQIPIAGSWALSVGILGKIITRKQPLKIQYKYQHKTSQTDKVNEAANNGRHLIRPATKH